MPRNNKKLISHTDKPVDINKLVKEKIKKIKTEGDKPYVTVEKQLDLLTQLTEFDFGRFLLQNQGINGYWTHYMLTFPWFGRKTGKNNKDQPLNKTEDFILNQSPTMLATQQRFEIFLKENQKCIKNDAKLACIPCGMMGELLYLNFDDINNIELIGIDYDPVALEDAKNLAKKKKLIKFTKLIQGDAWHLDFNNEFDLVSSNGLNIYEPDDQKVTELYHQFYIALKSNGKLVTSFLTFPPSLTDKCEWNMSKVNSDNLLLQKIIFSNIVEAKFQCYRSSEQTKKQLESVGFVDIQFIYDDAKIFPTVVAYKK